MYVFTYTQAFAFHNQNRLTKYKPRRVGLHADCFPLTVRLT